MCHRLVCLAAGQSTAGEASRCVGRYASQDEIVQVVQNYSSHGIQVDVLVIDWKHYNCVVRPRCQYVYRNVVTVLFV